MKIGQRNNSIADMTTRIGQRNKGIKMGARYRNIRNTRRGYMMGQSQNS